MKTTSKLNRILSFFVMLALLSASWLFSAQPVEAADGPIRDRSGFETYTLSANDDGSTGALPIGFTVNFFDQPHSTLFVNNNGNITFDAAQNTYTPYDLTSTTREIIAVFFADVDTRGTGSGLVTYGNDIVGGHQAFGVNYFDVGYYSANTDKLNSFQLILIDRSDIGPGDFDIEFNYDKIQWETGDLSGGSGGLGGNSARVGFSNGTGDAGTYFEQPGSAVSGAFLNSNLLSGLKYNSFNSGIPGRYFYEARNGIVNTSHTPLIFIPGVGGSKLKNDPNQNGDYDEIWPNTLTLLDQTDDKFLQVLKLNPSGTGPYVPNNSEYSTVQVGDIVRTEVLVKDVYTSTVKFFTQQRGYQEGRDFFVCPYDWRKHIPDIAAGGLDNTLDKCIDNALALNPEKSQVDILAHSMGGLVARYYVSDASRAGKVAHLVTLGTPYLGAPKIALGVIDKMCFMDFLFGSCWVNENMLHELLQNFPAGYEVAPSESYFQVYPDGYIYRDWDKNGDSIVDGRLNFDATSNLLSEHNSELTTQAQSYFTSVGGWTNNNGTNGVNVMMIVGSGLGTPQIIQEKQVRDWWNNPFLKKIVYKIKKVDGGDGTVPLYSANMRNPVLGIDLSDNVSTVYFPNVNHGDLPKKSQVLEVVATFFESNQSLAGSSSIDNFVFAQQDGPSLEPTHLNGQYLIFDGNVTIEVIDQFGNRIGLLDDGGAYEVNILGASFFPLENSFSVFLPNDRTYQIFVNGQTRTATLARIQKYVNDNIDQTTIYETMLMGEKSTATLYFNPGSTPGNFLLDQDGNGAIDSQVGVARVLDSQQSTDNISPQTTISISGTPSSNGWYEGLITVTITAEDNLGGVGIDKIEYSFDGGQTVSEYFSPFTIDASIFRRIMARSIDLAGNVSWKVVSAPTADVDVYIGGSLEEGTYTLMSGEEMREYYHVSGGPVVVESTNGMDIVSAIRLQSKPAATLYSFVETMGVPEGLLSHKYYFPTYNNTWGPLNSQIRFGNLDAAATTIRVTIGGVKVWEQSVPGLEERRLYFDVSDGPVIIESLDTNKKIVAAIRLQSKPGSILYSFSETMGIPDEQVSDTYYFPTYNNTWAPLNSQLRIGNLNAADTTVRVTIGSDIVWEDVVPGLEEKRLYFDVSDGPVKVESLDAKKIVAAIRLQSKPGNILYSFVETMGVPEGLLSHKYYFPTYNNTWGPLNSQIRFGNLDAAATTIRVTIGGVNVWEQSVPGREERRLYFDVSDGPVIIESLDTNKKIVAAIRLQSKPGSILYSFAETMGIPDEQMSGTFYFPTYNNTWAPLNSQIRFGVP